MTAVALAILPVSAASAATPATPAATPATPAATPAAPPRLAAVKAHWTSAKLLPGVGGDWSVPFSVSCTGSGDCTAGGEYGPDEPYTQSLPFVATETSGQWDSAKNLTGIPALNDGQYAAVTSVSCAWPGNCAAVGYYLTRATTAASGRVFVADQVNGVWQAAHPLAGVTAHVDIGALGVGLAIEVSCARATTSAARKAGLDCLVAGDSSSGGRPRGFTATAKHGAWGAAQLVLGLARLGGTRPSQVDAVSCPAPGSCAIGGYYTDGKGRRQAFAASEAKGSWHGALEVPGTGALNVKGSAEVDAVDCPTAGACTAAGDYRSKSGAAEFFVVNETAGTWRSAAEFPGVARLGTGAGFVDNGVSTGTGIVDVACTPATCEVGGTMDTKGGGSAGFLLGEVRGRWDAPRRVPGTDSAVTALSCPAAGECAAGGTVRTDGEVSSGIVLDQVSGVWGRAVTVDPAPANSPASAQVAALSCAAARTCAAVGSLPEGDEAGPLATVATEPP